MTPRIRSALVEILVVGLLVVVWAQLLPPPCISGCPGGSWAVGCVPTRRCPWNAACSPPTRPRRFPWPWWAAAPFWPDWRRWSRARAPC